MAGRTLTAPRLLQDESASARPSSWIRPVPNLISALRIVLALWFPFAPSRFWLVIAILAGASDGVDGLIARRFRVTSLRGGLLDAAADKLFTLVAFASFARAGLIEVWWLPLLLVRDLFVAVASVVFVVRRDFRAFARMQSRIAGKATTFLLFGLMAALLLPLPGAVAPLCLFTTLASFTAAVNYTRAFRASAAS